MKNAGNVIAYAARTLLNCIKHSYSAIKIIRWPVNVKGAIHIRSLLQKRYCCRCQHLRSVWFAAWLVLRECWKEIILTVNIDFNCGSSFLKSPHEKLRSSDQYVRTCAREWGKHAAIFFTLRVYAGYGKKRNMHLFSLPIACFAMLRNASQ